MINRGISGQTTIQMLARFRQDVLDLHPAVVHIMAGVNDINQSYGTVLTESNIASMVDLAKQHGIRVVIGAITPSSHFWMFPDIKPGPQIVALNAWLKRYAAQEKVTFVDYYAPLVDGSQGLRSEVSNEGLHPNRNVYAFMTPLAQAAIRKQLGESARRKRQGRS